MLQARTRDAEHQALVGPDDLAILAPYEPNEDVSLRFFFGFTFEGLG